MSDSTPDRHLSQLSTAWTALFRAHAGPADQGRAARAELLERYGTPVYRYLRAAVGEPDAADELYQEFALRLVRGDFQNASPGRGRFRDFLRRSLSNLITDHRRKQARRPAGLGDADPPAADPEPAASDSDEAFTAGWRAEVLARAWDALDRHERQTGQPVHTVLKARADRPAARSADLAGHLTTALGRPVTAEWVRKWLLKARERFAAAVVAEVAGTVDPPTPEAVAEELTDLGLLDYCREALPAAGGG